MKLIVPITALFSIAVTAAGTGMILLPPTSNTIPTDPLEYPALPTDTENVDCYYSRCSVRPVYQSGFIARELFFCNRRLGTKQKNCCEQVKPRKPVISMSRNGLVGVWGRLRYYRWKSGWLLLWRNSKWIRNLCVPRGEAHLVRKRLTVDVCFLSTKCCY
jgi:hypothetical protein